MNKLMQDEVYVFPMSFAQQRLWLLDQMEGCTPFYNIVTAIRLRGGLLPDVLAAALSGLVQRHESLRTAFGEEAGQPVQLVHGARPVALMREDLSALPPDGAMDAVARLSAAEAATAFDLARDPLLRARLLRLGADDHVLLLTMHHIISDGWSMGVLVRDMGVLYSALAAGDEPVLPELDIQYPDFAEWQRDMLQGRTLDRLLGYWKPALAGAPPLLTLPTDHPRPAVQTYAGDVVRFTVDRETVHGLKALGQKSGASLFMVLVAAYGVLLSRLSGQDQVVIGSPVASRSRPELEDLIGFFVNTVPLRLDLSTDMSFTALVAQARDAVVGALDHQDLPFEMLVEAVQPERSLSHAPLFQAMLTLQNTPAAPPAVAGLSFEPLDVHKGTALYDLTAEFTEFDGGLDGSLEYSTALFSPETAARFAAMLKTLLRMAAGDPSQAVSALPLQTGPLQTCNDGLAVCRAPVPVDAAPLVLVHAAVAAQAARTPGAVALRRGADTLTYGQLHLRVQAMAAGLSQAGVGRGDLVGVCLGPVPDLACALLAVLECGAAYVPLDPNYPEDRLRQMTADARLAVVIGAGGIDPAALAGHAPEDRAPQERAAVEAGPGDMIYAIFTSGSTGRPKLAGVNHGGFARLMQWFLGEFQLDATDHNLVMSSPSFDLTQKNLFAPLMTGATLNLPENADYDPAALARLVAERQVRFLNCTPSAFLPLTETDQGPGLLESLRLVFLGGEPIPLARLLPWLHSPSCTAQIVNTYGPTECTDVVAFHRLDPKGDLRTAVPLGQPVWGAVLAVVDGAGRPVPVGVAGEIAVTGDGVGRGYLNDRRATAAAFVPHGLDGSRLYATGDLGRMDAQGNLTFLGRRDHQVKMRGYRIELGEIEAALAFHPQLREAVVTASGDRLVAYVVADNETVTAESLREHLQRVLPHYMVPSVFMMVESLPLTPSGKVDRGRLPDPGGAPASAERVAPRNETERRVLEIWRAVLGRDELGVTDDFFALGGHSLLAAQVASRLRQSFGVDVPMRLLFERPTVAQLAEYLSPLGGELADLLAELDGLSDDEVNRLLGEELPR